MKLRTHSGWQRTALRLSFAWALFTFFPASLKYHQQPVPNGLAQYVDLTALAVPGVYTPLRYVAWLCLGLYAAGKASRVAMVYLTTLAILIGTLSNSQGAVGHGYNAIVLVLLGHCLGYLSFPLWRRIHEEPQRAHPDDLAINFSMQMLACVYVIAAISKLILTKGEWIARSPNLAVDVIKANAQAHYNYFLPDRLRFGETAAQFIIEHHSLAQLFFGAGLVLELVALLALKSRVWAFLLGVGLYLLHESIYHLMRLSFHYNKLMLLIFFVGLPFLAADAAQWLHARWRERRPAVSNPSG